MPTVRILAAIVDTSKLTLYKEDGSQIKIPQGSDRLAPILEMCKPLSNPVGYDLPTNDAGYPYVEVMLGEEKAEPEAPRDMTYRDYEDKAKKAGGFTRFFRVLKSSVSHLLKGGTDYEPAAPQVLGTIPQEPVVQPVEGEQAPVIAPRISSAIQDIMTNAKPVSDESFYETKDEDHETIVAIVDDGQGNAKIIPEAEKLKGHLAHSVKSDNIVGMQTFLTRLGACISKRGHTVEDLLRFMDRGDLPISDDGCIIAYKVLKTINGKGNDVFYDCHTGKIPQRVGSYVCQDERLIDPSRFTECSTGLHIARRGYLRGFSGNIIVMVKFRPEDVIAVPANEPNKIRVKGYHILAKIPSDQHNILRSNKEMQGTNALKQLTMAIKGEHIGIIEEVRITSASGGSYEIVPMDADVKSPPRPTKDTAVTAPVQQEKPKLPEPKPVLTAPVVDPKALAKEIQSQAKPAQPGKPTQAQHAAQLLQAKAYAELLAFKKASKKSWASLNISTAEEAIILQHTETPTADAKSEPAKESAAVVQAQPAPQANSTKEVPAEAPKKEAPVAEKISLTGTRAEVARILFDQAVAGDRSRWKTLWLHRKECKKSWEILGFSPKEIERIKLNKPDSV